MKLSEYASQMGISYVTAYRWYKTGKIPHRCEQMPSGGIYVYMDDITSTTSQMESNSTKEVYIYSRVSSHDQKGDLVRQKERIRDFCSSNGYVIKDEVSEVASGMNSNRPKLNKLLQNPEVKIIVVENRDRLTRFGYELIKSALDAQGREIILLNEVPDDMDILQDFIDVVTSMCSRIYGQRSAKNRVERIKKALEEE